MLKIKQPKAKVGDVIVGSKHPDKGTVMFMVDRAYLSGVHDQWVYVSAEDDQVVEQFIDYVYPSTLLDHRPV